MKALRISIIAAVAGYLLYVGLVLGSMFWSAHLLRPVKIGMSESQVRNAVGAPLSEIRHAAGTKAWAYTAQPWTDAVVHFDEQGLVSAIETD
jgi:hypothetical protein